MPEPRDAPSSLLLLGHSGAASAVLRELAAAGNASSLDDARIDGRSDGRGFRLIAAADPAHILAAVVGGTATVEGALLAVDPSTGIDHELRRALALLALLRVRPVGVAVAGDGAAVEDPARASLLTEAIPDLFAAFELTAHFVLALEGRDAAAADASGARRLARALGKLAAMPVSGPLRLAVDSAVAQASGATVSARVLSGCVSVGDSLLFSPANRDAEVSELRAAPAGTPIARACAGQSVTLTTIEDVAASPGDVASLRHELPVETDVFRARLAWLGSQPPRPGAQCSLILHGHRVPATLESVGTTMTGQPSVTDTGPVATALDLAELVVRTPAMVALDTVEVCPATGRVMVCDGETVLGGGAISMLGYADQRGLITVRATNVRRVEHRVGRDLRAARNLHSGGVLWLTGLSGAGKSTLAFEVERELFARGYQVYVLDGDNLRQGLNANLGFSPEDRAENIRRVGETAALFARAGMIAVTAFISPYRSDRARARAAIPEAFHEIHIKCGLETCEKRDPKGLYKRARAGEIADFTGISAPYEAPQAPQLVVDTETADVARGVAKIVDYALAAFTLSTE